MEQHQATSQDTEPSHKLTINNFPNELLIEVFDFCRQDISHRLKWKERCVWFNLLRVCRKWRAIIFASSSRLDVCPFLKPNNGAHMKTLTSTNPLISIVIKYDTYEGVTPKDMGRLLSALKRPDRIRGIDLSLLEEQLDKFFKATKCPFPPLESLALHNSNGLALKIPPTFLKGTNLHRRLRSLKLHPVSLTSTFRFLSSATALTDLSLKIDRYSEEPDLSHLLSQLQGLINLRHFDLEINRSRTGDYVRQLTDPKVKISLAKLTSFHYYGYSTFLDFLMMGFEAPSLQDVNIYLYDWNQSLPPIPHFPQFINGVGEHNRAIQVVFQPAYFDFSFLAPSEGDGHHSLRFRLHLPHFPPASSDIQNGAMEMTSMFSAKLSTTEELVIIDTGAREREVIPWRTFLKQFPSVKEFRIQGTNNPRVASALEPHRERPNSFVLPALERIIFRTNSYVADDPFELAAFQPFVTACQHAGRQVEVTCTVNNLSR